MFSKALVSRLVANLEECTEKTFKEAFGLGRTYRQLANTYEGCSNDPYAGEPKAIDNALADIKHYHTELLDIIARMKESSNTTYTFDVVVTELPRADHP